MEVKHYTGVLALVGAATITIVSVAAVRAQQPAPPTSPAPQQPAQPAMPAEQAAPPQGQRPGGPAGGGQAAPAVRPALPAAASSIAANPEPFYGQYVSIYATVEKSLAPLAFSVDQDKTQTTGKELIVLAPRMHEPVEPNTYVTVIGEVVRPDVQEITKRAKGSTNGIAEVLAQNPGRPVILATAVINPALTDLAKFVPPPMTPEEAVLDKTMKGVGAANGGVRKGVDASNLELVKTNTAVLTKAFTDVEAFWKARGKADAVKFAQDARTAAQAIETSAAGGNWGDAKNHINTLGQQCQSCHGIYRERLEDGSFAVKPGK